MFVSFISKTFHSRACSIGFNFNFFWTSFDWTPRDGAAVDRSIRRRGNLSGRRLEGSAVPTSAVKSRRTEQVHRSTTLRAILKS